MGGESMAANEATSLNQAEDPCLAIGAPQNSLLGELLAALVRQLHPELRVVRTSVAQDPGYLLITSGSKPDDAVVVFVGDPPTETLREALSKGNRSLLMLTSTKEEFVAALDSLVHGRFPYVSAHIIRRLAAATFVSSASSELGPLSQRELEVLRLVESGFSNHEIGSRLFVSPNTVRSHLQSISAKLGVTGRIRLVAKAREQRILSESA